MVKNCLSCTYCILHDYRENTCTAPQVRPSKKDISGYDKKISAPACKEVHPDQNRDCKYFKISLSGRLILIKNWILQLFKNEN